MIIRERLIEIVKKFSNQKILVVGDLLLDKYLWSDVERISPEAPVPIAKITGSCEVLGGAANTASNLATLGVSVDILGRVGADHEGQALRKLLEAKNINCFKIVIDKKIPTISKTRIMCGSHQLLRFDQELIQTINKKTEEKIIEKLKQEISQYKVIVISDYAKGFVSERLAQTIISLSAKNNIRVLSDPTPETFLRFTGSYLVKPNIKEAGSMLGLKIKENLSNLQEVGNRLKKILKLKVLIITLGKHGMASFNGKKKMLKIKTFAKEVFDVSGAGDSTIAAIAASLSSGATLEESAHIGNFCAGVVVGKIGTSTCTQEELITAINDSKS